MASISARMAWIVFRSCSCSRSFSARRSLKSSICRSAASIARTNSGGALLAERTFVTPNYYVQQLFSLNRPDVELPVKLFEGAERQGVYVCAGTAGVETIVKIVNAAEEPREIAVNLKGPATVTTLAGAKNDVNTIDGEKICPVVSKRDFDGAITVPARSLTVLRVACR